MMAAKMASIVSLSRNLGKLFLRSTKEFRSTIVQRTFSHPVHTTTPKRDLMEFFDSKENWGEPSVRVGRPWKLDELRLKSNSDLHKLWYVLLKERNMLMTMEEEYKRQSELFPSPERLEKVEESMENLLDVVAERNRALSLLETGEAGEPGRRWTYNQLGIGFWRKCREHHMPLHANPRMVKTSAFVGPWQHKFLRLMRERRLWERNRAKRREYRRWKEYSAMFPNADVQPNLKQFQTTLASSMKGPPPE